MPLSLYNYELSVLICRRFSLRFWLESHNRYWVRHRASSQLLWLVAKFPSAIVTTLCPGRGSLDREGWGVSVLSQSRNCLEITTTLLWQHSPVIRETNAKAWLLAHGSCHREIPNNHDLIYLKCRRLSLGPDCIALWLILNLSLHFHKAPLWLPQSKLVLRV